MGEVLQEIPAFLKSSASKPRVPASGGCLSPDGLSNCFPLPLVCRPGDTAAGAASPDVSNPSDRLLAFPRGGSRARGLEVWKGVSICLRGGLVETQRLTAGFLLIFAVLFAMVAQAQAATLISNTGQPTHPHGRGNVGFSAGYHFSSAQKFTTGDNEDGYTLSDVVAVFISSNSGVSPVVSIYTAANSGKPGSSLYTLSNPGTFGTGNMVFTAPPNATLEKETKYFVVFEETSAVYTLTGTGTNNEDSGGASGWSIANGRHTRNSDSGGWSANTPFETKIKINGTVNTPPNNPATGTVTVSGMAQVGQTLTALTSGISDDDGLTGVSYGYQWIRVDSDGSGNPTDISSATSGTYAPMAADVGKRLKVKVSFTDDADNDEELTSDAYPAGTGTVRAANTPPEFGSSSTTRSFAETIGDATVGTAGNMGSPVSAMDDDNDTLTYSLDGTDKDKFTIDTMNGQIKTKAGEKYDYEAKPSYSVEVDVSDGNGGTDSKTVTINVTDQDEAPLAPAVPTVEPVAPDKKRNLQVRWSPPANQGRPSITGYSIQYQAESSGNWISGGSNLSSSLRSTKISGLIAGTEYEVQVLAANDEGDGAWSKSGSGTTENANNVPEFSGGTVTRSFAETMGDATVGTAGNMGSPVSAMDDDNDTLTYSLDGTDKDKFTIDTMNGQIKTKAGEKYDYEAKPSYSVEVDVSDGNGGTDSKTVTINVTDQDEAPLAPAVPTVEPVAPDKKRNLQVRWSPPANQGRPSITGYSIQYQAESSGNWISGGSNLSSSLRSTKISGLIAGTEYEVQVLAANDEGDGAWSKSGSGTTENANNVPELCSTDWAALVALYNATDGANWGTPWNTNENLTPDLGLSNADWNGVETGSNCRVVKLELGSNNLSGTIPTELGELTSLQTLDLSDNMLTGEIPDLSGSTALLELHLSQNNLTGGIPTWLENLTALEYLDLSDNMLTGEIPDLSGSTALLELHLSQNNLTGPIPTWLGDLTNLQQLYLNNNMLTESTPATELGTLTDLEELGLWGNEELTWDTISNELGKRVDRAALRTLYNVNGDRDWTNNGNWFPYGEDPLFLYTSWQGVSTDMDTGRVSGLNLSNNGLKGELTDALEALSGLKELNISYNRQLTGVLPLRLMDLPLETLDIRCTGVSTPADTDFQTWLSGISFQGTCPPPPPPVTPQQPDQIPTSSNSPEGTVSVVKDDEGADIAVAISPKNGGAVSLGNGKTIELTIDRTEAPSQSGNPAIILPLEILEDISEISFKISEASPEAPPSGFRLVGLVVDIDIGYELGEGETVTVCLPVMEVEGGPVLFHYDEESAMWESLESWLATVNGTPSVCAETDSFSFFGIFVAEPDVGPVIPDRIQNTGPEGEPAAGQGGGGCSIASNAGTGNTPESIVFNLLLVVFVLVSVVFPEKGSRRSSCVLQEIP